MSNNLDFNTVNEVLTREIDRVTRVWAKRSAALFAIEEKYLTVEAVYLQYKDAGTEVPEDIADRYFELDEELDARRGLFKRTEEDLRRAARMCGQFQLAVALAQSLLDEEAKSR